MEKSSKNKARLGIFVIVGTFLLVTILYLIGNRQNLFSNTIKLHAQFSNVNGLQLGNNVRYLGINAGTVHAIKMQSDTLIIVEMLLKESMTKYLRKDAVASIGSDGLVGNMIVNIIPNEGKLAPVISGDTIASYNHTSTDNMMTTLDATNQNLAVLSTDLLKITNKMLQGDGTIALLLNNPQLANNIKESIENLKLSTKDISKITQELSSKLTHVDMENSVAGVLLTDSIQGQKIKSIIENIDISSQYIKQASTSIDTMTSRILNSKGAMNHIITNETFVKDIDSTLKHIKEGTAKFNENMDALKHSIFFRRYFKKKEKQELESKIKD